MSGGSQVKLDPKCLHKAMATATATLQESGGAVGLSEGAKIVIEKYVDSPEEAKRIIEKRPPIMTLSRAKRMIDQGLHIHDEAEYIHCLTKVTGAKKIHGMWHCAISADTLKSIMNDAKFDMGENIY